MLVVSRNRSISQLFRYGLVGLSVNLIGYALYLFLTFVGGEPKVVMTLLYIVGTFSSFFLNRFFTFKHSGFYGTAFGRFWFTYMLGYLINLLALYVGVDVIGFPHQIVQAIMIFIVAGVLFLLQKFWVFRR